MRKIRIGNLIITLRGIVEALAMILFIGMMDIFYIRVLNINSPSLLVPLNIFICYIFLRSIKKEVKEIESMRE